MDKTWVIKPVWDNEPPTDGWLFAFSSGEPILPRACCEPCWWGRWPPIGPPALPRAAVKLLFADCGTWGTAPIGPWTVPRAGIAYGWEWGAALKAGRGILGTGKPAWYKSSRWVILGYSDKKCYRPLQLRWKNSRVGMKKKAWNICAALKQVKFWLKKLQLKLWKK